MPACVDVEVEVGSEALVDADVDADVLVDVPVESLADVEAEVDVDVEVDVEVESDALVEAEVDVLVESLADVSVNPSVFVSLPETDSSFGRAIKDTLSSFVFSSTLKYLVSFL